MSNFYLYRDLLPFFEMKLSKWTKIKRTFFLNQSIEHLESVFHNSFGIPTNIMPLKVKNSYKGADFLANKIAKKLERTRAYRKVLKTSYLETQKNPFVKGIRISISGRLGGAELASQQVKKLGPTSLQEFNEQIDYAASDAVTKFGIIGVKVWMCFHKEISQKG
jgi:small subunit ribosomal protein S3